MKLLNGNYKQHEIVCNILSDIEDDDLIDIINDYCDNYEYDFKIYYMSELDDLMDNKTATEILSELSNDFDINDDYFIKTINGFKSGDDVHNLMDCDYNELARYLIPNNDINDVLEYHTERLLHAFIDYASNVIDNSVYRDELQDIISYIDTHYWSEVYVCLWEDLIIKAINGFSKLQNEHNELGL